MTESQVKAPPTILVVDDNEANRTLARHTLEDEGYRVMLATGGQAGIEAFEAAAPDCVLLDVRMPEVDGFAVCERIRKLPGGADTPVVFLTALRDVDTFDRALAAGADDFLTKPVRPSELLIRVQAALKVRRMGLELREHYALMRRQRDDLLRTQLQKERLMAFIVHDLKGPVNGMDLHAQFLLRDRALSADARESAAKIRVAAQQLNRMIVDLLDVSKADEGKLEARRSEIDARAFVAGVVAELALSAEARRITLRTDVAVERLRADEQLLRRTLVNLVENAIRHAPEDSEVTVSARADSEATTIRVADAGRGVPEAAREKIFEPFVQVEPNSGAQGPRSNRGLGLAFCRLAVEAQGGRIWVEDAAPGAVFVVRLPHGE